MRVLQVSPYAMDRRGGVQTHVRDVAAWLAAQGHEVAIVAPGPSGGGGSPPVVPLGRHLSIGLSGTRFEVTWVGGRELAAARDRLAAASIDVVHLHTPFVPLLPWRVWRDFRRPTVATFHATIPAQDRLLGALLGRVARAMRVRLAASIAVSPSAAALLRPAESRWPLTLLPPAIDLTPWRAAGLAAAGRQRSAVRRLLFLGRFEERKGLRVLIDAWPAIVARAGEVPIELVIAGGGQLAPLAASLAARDPGRVRIVATPDDATARRMVAEADLLIAPSLWGESFGLVLIEAMAAGTPVVAARNSGYAEVLTGPGDRLLTPPGDAPALAQVIGDLLADPSALADLGAWGRAHVAQFDVASVGPRLVEIYLDVCGLGRPASNPSDGVEPSHDSRTRSVAK